VRQNLQGWGQRKNPEINMLNSLTIYRYQNPEWVPKQKYMLGLDRNKNIKWKKKRYIPKDLLFTIDRLKRLSC